MAKIFYVEDDPNLGLVVKDTLISAGHEVTHFCQGDQAMENFSKKEYDLCLLDVMLPGVDGFTIARTIRLLNPGIPIIFISAKVQLEDKLEGLGLGGDDYIFKPFSIEELLLKVRIFFNRKNSREINPPDRDKKLCCGNFELDALNQLLKNGEEEFKLTLRETELLRFFFINKNRLLKREEILMALWGQDDYFLGRSLDVFISRLRKHLKSDLSVQIETVPRVGFRLVC